jgi:hypothetical protein
MTALMLKLGGSDVIVDVDGVVRPARWIPRGRLGASADHTPTRARELDDLRKAGADQGRASRASA